MMRVLMNTLRLSIRLDVFDKDFDLCILDGCF